MVCSLDIKVMPFIYGYVAVSVAGGEVSKVAMMDARKIVEVIANSVASKVTQ